MTKVKHLRNIDGERFYPVTSTQAVYDADGNTLEERMTLERADTVKAEPTDIVLEAIEPNIVTDALRKTEQALTEEERKKVLKNLGNPESKLFVDMWNEACGKYGRYNRETGLFELNGLTDITYSEALLIARKSASVPQNPTASLGSAYTGTDVRTVPPFGGWGNRYGAYSIAGAFKDCPKLEVVIVAGGNMTDMGSAFYGCSRLRKVVLNFGYYITGASSAFIECPALEEVTFTGNIHTSISFADSPLLSLASIENVVRRMQSGNEHILTLHPTAYARVTEEIFALAAEKNITIATT